MARVPPAGGARQVHRTRGAAAGPGGGVAALLEGLADAAAAMEGRARAVGRSVRMAEAVLTRPEAQVMAGLRLLAVRARDAGIGADRFSALALAAATLPDGPGGGP